MALSVNTNLGITGQSSNLFVAQPTDIVKGDELTRVAKEILSATPRKTVINTNQADVKVFNQGADVNQIKQIATNRTGYDVVISQDAQQAINNLKAQAAQVQTHNLTRVVDGKIHINSEKTDVSEAKSIFNAVNYNGLEVSESSNLYKDKKGPGGFYIPFEKDEEDKNTKEGINLVI